MLNRLHVNNSVYAETKLFLYGFLAMNITLLNVDCKNAALDIALFDTLTILIE